MENKPTTRIINIIMTGLFIIIAITLVTIAGSFYTVEQNAKKSGQEQLMRTLNYVTNNLKLVIENRSLSLQQFSHELTSDDHPEAPLGEADKEAIIAAYLGVYADQTNLLIQLDGSGVLAKAWQFKDGALQELLRRYRRNLSESGPDSGIFTRQRLARPKQQRIFSGKPIVRQPLFPDCCRPMAKSPVILSHL